MVPSTPGQPAIPSDAAAQWAHAAATSYTFTNVPPGTHTFTVQLVNNDHTPVIPLMYQSVTVTVAAPPGPSVSILSPQDSADIPAGDVTITIQANNFNIVEKQGQANVAGEGHVHYYLDLGTVPFTPGKPAIPSDPKVTWAHMAASSYTFRNILPGMHTLSVQLVNNDHTPVVPLVYQSIMVIATGQTVIPATTVPATTTPPGAGKTVQMTLTARNIAFDESTLSAPAGSTVVMTFINRDSGVPHNVALYTDPRASTRIFAGDLVTGPKTVTYTFRVPSTPGNYFFRCDVHPTMMTGTFVMT